MLTLPRADATWEGFVRGPTPRPELVRPQFQLDDFSAAREAWREFKGHRLGILVALTGPAAHLHRIGSLPVADQAWDALVVPLPLRAPALPVRLEMEDLLVRAEDWWWALQSPLRSKPRKREVMNINSLFDAEGAWEELVELWTSLDRILSNPRVRPGIDTTTVLRRADAVWEILSQPLPDLRRRIPEAMDLEIRRCRGADQAWGRYVQRTSRPRRTARITTPVSLAIPAGWPEAESAWRALFPPPIGKLTIDNSEWVAPTLTVDTVAKGCPRRHAWQSYAASSRKGAECWPTHTHKPRPTGGRRTMFVGRYQVAIQTVEGVEVQERFGRLRRVWVTKKTNNLTQRTWPECLTAAEGDLRMAERYFRNQSCWVVERIAPTALPNWQQKGERKEKFVGLDADGVCKRPAWLSNEEHADRMNSEFAQLLAAEGSSSAGNPDLQKKFARY